MQFLLIGKHRTGTQNSEVGENEHCDGLAVAVKLQNYEELINETNILFICAFQTENELFQRILRQ